jgi:hypothetical protein
MPEWLGLLLGGSGFLGLAALLTVLATRKRDRNTDSKERFAQNIELRKFVSEEVTSAVTAATAPLEARISEQAARIAALEAREDSTKTIVRRFFQRLVFWDTTGRVGPMPMPSPADMRDLDIEDLQPKEPSNG